MSTYAMSLIQVCTFGQGFCLFNISSLVRQRPSSAGVIGQTGLQCTTGEHRHRTSAGLEWILLQMVRCGLTHACLCRGHRADRRTPAPSAPQVSAKPACTIFLKVCKPPSGPQMMKSRPNNCQPLQGATGLTGYTGLQGITGEQRYCSSAGLEWILLQMVRCGLMDVCLCRVPQGWRGAPASGAPQVNPTPACTH